MRKLLRLLLIMLLTIVWTASRAQEITMDFADNSGWKIPGKDKTPNPPQTFGDGNNAITLSGDYYYVSAGSYLMLKSGGTLTFSTFDFDVERIVVKGFGSTNFASLDVFVGDTSVSGKVIANGVRALWINENSQAKGNVYTLKVTDDNAHIGRIEIYRKGSFAPEGKAVSFVAGKDIAAGNSIMKDGVTISGKNIKFFRNVYGTYTFERGCNFTISVQTGTIKKIEFLGDSYLKYLTGDENLSVSNLKAEWTGNAQEVSFTSPKGAPRVSSITVYVSLPTISLSESAENIIENRSDVNISLNRKLVKGVWNTICLPFDVSAAQAKSAFGADVRIAALNAESKGNTLMFDNKTAEGIKAAVPYLIMPSEVKADDKYEFYNVSIKPENVTPAATVRTLDGFAFKGIYNKVDITQDINNPEASDSYAAFLGANNTLFKAKSGTTTKGFRAYFAIPNSTATSALRVVVDGNATSIKNINCGVVESDDAVYNLQGQRVDAHNLMPGLYIKAGKKFVVR